MTVFSYKDTGFAMESIALNRTMVQFWAFLPMMPCPGILALTTLLVQ